jgi:hypothetical protein
MSKFELQSTPFPDEWTILRRNHSGFLDTFANVITPQIDTLDTIVAGLNLLADGDSNV